MSAEGATVPRAEATSYYGRPVLKAELIHLIEEVPGVEGVDALDIRDDYLNNAPFGYKKNSFQFITAVIYRLR